MSDSFQNKVKYLSPEQKVNKAEDAGERSLRVTMTTGNPDREGDIVEPGGILIKNFMNNPVVLWAHNKSQLPIGRVKIIERLLDRMEAIVEFADTDAGREVYKLYKDGFMRGWSIGFVPIKGEGIANDGGDTIGLRITESELVELSAVPVPANAEALTIEAKALSSETRSLLSAAGLNIEPGNVAHMEKAVTEPQEDFVDERTNEMAKFEELKKAFPDSPEMIVEAMEKDLDVAGAKALHQERMVKELKDQNEKLNSDLAEMNKKLADVESAHAKALEEKALEIENIRKAGDGIEAPLDAGEGDPQEKSFMDVANEIKQRENLKTMTEAMSKAAGAYPELYKAYRG